MNKQIKTTLPFILGAILVVIFAVAGCNNSKSDKAAKKDSVPVIDTMEHHIGDSSPIIDPKPK